MNLDSTITVLGLALLTRLVGPLSVPDLLFYAALVTAVKTGAYLL